MPDALALSSTRGVTVRAGGRRVAARVQRAGRTLILTLKRPAHAMTVTVGPSGLAISGGRNARSVRGGAVAVTLTDAGGGLSSVRIVPRVRS